MIYDIPLRSDRKKFNSTSLIQQTSYSWARKPFKILNSSSLKTSKSSFCVSWREGNFRSVGYHQETRNDQLKFSISSIFLKVSFL